MENNELNQFMSESIFTSYIDHKIKITLNNIENKQTKAEKFLAAFDDFMKNI